MIVPLQLPITSDPGRYGPDGATRLINCYPENRAASGKIQFPLYAKEGLLTVASLENGGEARGMFALDNDLLAVGGRQLYSVDAGGGVTVKGAIPGAGTVYFAANEVPQVAIVSGGQRAVYESGILTPITDPDLPPPETCAYINGYILYSIRDGRVFFSGINDAANINPLDFFTAEGSPDGLLRVYVENLNIWLIGATSTEIWVNTGDATNPFQRAGGAFFEFGTIAPASVATLSDAIVLVTDDLRVEVASASGARRRISNHAVETAIMELDDRSQIEGSVYHIRGHEFYRISSPEWTWVYDGLVGDWFECAAEQKIRDLPAYSARYQGAVVAQDYETGDIMVVDPDTYSNAGELLSMRVRFPVHTYPFKMEINALYVDTLPGFGLNENDSFNDDPFVEMRVSKDGGQTWGNARRARTGKQGRFRRRAYFNRLGTFKEDGAVIELTMSSATARAITGMAADVVRLEA